MSELRSSIYKDNSRCKHTYLTHKKEWYRLHGSQSHDQIDYKEGNCRNQPKRKQVKNPILFNAVIKSSDCCSLTYLPRTREKVPAVLGWAAGA